MGWAGILGRSSCPVQKLPVLGKRLLLPLAHCLGVGGSCCCVPLAQGTGPGESQEQWPCRVSQFELPVVRSPFCPFCNMTLNKLYLVYIHDTLYRFRGSGPSFREAEGLPSPLQQNELASPTYMDADNLIQWPGVRFWSLQL